jgi:AraC-like DNA-binding protein
MTNVSEDLVSRFRRERRVHWAGGEVTHVHYRATEFSVFETKCGDAHHGIFVLGGRALVRNRTINAVKAPRSAANVGEVNFFGAGSIITGETIGELEYLEIKIDTAFARGACDQLATCDPASPWIRRALDSGTWSLAHKLSYHLQSGKKIEPLFVDGVSSLLAFRLGELVYAPAFRRQRGGTLSPKRLGVVTDFIDANLHKQLRLSDLAECVGLSPDQFSVVFRNATKMSPHRFVVSQRIERAKLLLRSNSAPLAGLAVTLGFSSQSHFTQAFRKATGLTPMRYRSQED